MKTIIGQYFWLSLLLVSGGCGSPQVPKQTEQPARDTVSADAVILYDESVWALDFRSQSATRINGSAALRLHLGRIDLQGLGSKGGDSHLAAGPFYFIDTKHCAWLVSNDGRIYRKAAGDQWKALVPNQGELVSYALPSDDGILFYFSGSRTVLSFRNDGRLMGELRIAGASQFDNSYALYSVQSDGSVVELRPGWGVQSLAKLPKKDFFYPSLLVDDKLIGVVRTPVGAHPASLRLHDRNLIVDKSHSNMSVIGVGSKAVLLSCGTIHDLFRWDGLKLELIAENMGHLERGSANESPQGWDIVDSSGVLHRFVEDNEQLRLKKRIPLPNAGYLLFRSFFEQGAQWGATRLWYVGEDRKVRSFDYATETILEVE